ncbi:MAG: PAC2 family protein [Promethearchaeota archaeon]
MNSIQPIQHFDLKSNRGVINPICVIGMPGVADIGKFAVDQLIGLFNAKKLYDLIFYGYPAGVIIDKSVISAPKAEIFYWEDENAKNDLFFITADAQPMNPREIYELSDFIVEFLMKYNISFFVSLDGYPLQNVQVNNPKIFITSTSESYKEKMILREECFEISKGVVIGANGLIPSLAHAKYNVDGVVLLAETSNMALMNENMTDLNASMKLIKILDSIFNLSLGLDFSKKNVDSMNKNLERKRKELENELNINAAISSKGEKEKVLYI